MSIPKKNKFLRIVWTALKVVGIVACFVLVAISVVSWVVLERRNDWLLDELQTYLSESQSGELVVESVGFTIFRSFPDITIKVGGISYFERADTLRAPGEAPILRAEKIFVAIKLLPLMSDELMVSEISVSDAQLNVRGNKDGKTNIEMALARPSRPGTSPKIVSRPRPRTPAPPKDTTKAPTKKVVEPVEKRSSLRVDLEYISLQNILLTWHEHGNADTMVVFMKDVKAKLYAKDSAINVSLKSSSTVRALSINGVHIPVSDLAFNTEFRYESSSQTLTIGQGEVNNGLLFASLQGSYAHKDGGSLDVILDASSNDLKLLAMIIKPEVLARNKALLERGDIYARGRVFGTLANGRPQFDITFGINDLDLNLPRGLGTMAGVGFDGSFKSGDQPELRGAVIEVTKLRGNIPGGYIRGGFSISNLKDPYVKLDLGAQLALDGYDEVFQIEAIKKLRGKVIASARFDGPLKMFGEHVMDSSRSSTIVLEDISFILNRTNQPISALSAKVENRNNQATVRNFTFQYGQSAVNLDASIGNLVYVLLGRERNIRASGHVESRQLFTAAFIFDTTKVADIQDRISNLSFDFQVSAEGQSAGFPALTPTVSFDVTNLKSTFDELPDIVELDARGVFTKGDDGIHLDLGNLDLVLPQGRVNATGHLLVASQRLWEFDARAKTQELPWVYISEVAAEIAPELEPTAKKLPKPHTTLLTADLDVSAAIITYPFDFRKLEIRDSRVTYTMEGMKPFSADKVNVNLDHLTFIHVSNSGRITGLKSTRGVISLERLSVPGLHPIDLGLDVEAENNVARFAFTSTTQVAKAEHGIFIADVSKKEFTYELKYQVDDANLEPFVKKFYKEKFIDGLIDYDLDLKASGSAWPRIKESLKGTIEVRSDSLQLYGIDVDKVLRKFEKTQNFNLTDVGALLIAGPVGLAVTKGADFVSLAKVNPNPSERTKIKTLLTRWSVEDRQLRTLDVALTTLQNRIAVDGVIDVGRDSIPGLTIYVVDAKGCALMNQQLYGKTNDLKTGKLKIAKTMLGPVVNFANAVVGKECVVVYAGEVAAPKPK